MQHRRASAPGAEYVRSSLQVELFPALRGGDIDWRSASKVGSNGGLPEAKYSAFLGDYAPVADRAAQPTAAPAGGAAADGNATPPQTTAAPVECATSAFGTQLLMLRVQVYNTN